MARKTFVSYKYSEARSLRDDILSALGDDAIYYRGETSSSPDLTDESTENIKEHLKEMMFPTSVTIVVISPNVRLSKWIDWEIEYTLREYSRDGRTSRTNGLVGVIQEVGGSIDWLVTRTTEADGCTTRTITGSKLYPIIKENRFNRPDYAYACSRCRTYNQLDGSYFSLVDESRFLDDPDKFIENAYEKSLVADEFDLCKSR